MSQGLRKCAIGIDFGTTNSTVAMFDGRDVVSVEFPNERGSVVPSALYWRRDNGGRTVGSRALAAYMEDNERRTVRLSRESLGDLDMYTGEGTFTFQVHGLADTNMPGRLFRSLKRWLGHKDIESLQLFETMQPVVGLISPVLAYLASGVGLLEGEQVYLGRPVHFGGSDDVAQRRLSRAANQGGVTDFTFYPEPAAAAISYVHGRDCRPGDTFLCFDFGGGTLDLCVLRFDGATVRILATHGAPLGGDLIDQLIYKHKVFPELGDGAPLTMDTMDGRHKTYRFHLFHYEEELLNWQLSHRLNRPEMLTPVRRSMDVSGETGLRLRRLHAVIRHNLSYRILQAIERAKIQLSDACEASIDVPQVELSVPITRREFEACLAGVLNEAEECVRATLDQAGIPPTDVRQVVCTGGSSRIPAVRARLQEILDRPIVEHEAFTGVAAGLALANYHGYASPLAG